MLMKNNEHVCNLPRYLHNVKIHYSIHYSVKKKKKKGDWFSHTAKGKIISPEHCFPLGPSADLPELRRVFQSHRIQLLKDEKQKRCREKAERDCSGIHLVHYVIAVSRDTRWVCRAATKDSHACWESRDRSPHLWMMARTMDLLLTRGKMVHFYSWHECDKTSFW